MSDFFSGQNCDDAQISAALDIAESGMMYPKSVELICLRE
jgi:hypothetical protein